MTSFASLNNLWTRFRNVLMVTIWPSIMHANRPIQTSLGMYRPSPNTVHARLIVSCNLLNGVSWALSRMQASHSLASFHGMDGWSSCHIGRANYRKMVHLHQYSIMVIGHVTCWIGSKARLVDEDTNSKLFTMRNLMIEQTVRNSDYTIIEADNQQMCNNTSWMCTRSSSSMSPSYRCQM